MPRRKTAVSLRPAAPRLWFRGVLWEVISIARTSDGFLLGTAQMIDSQTEETVLDESGFPILHSVFLGREP